MFALLVDRVIHAIHESDLGCHVDKLNFGILMYADDLILLSASLFQLQSMVNICVSELFELDLTINSKKSSCTRIGKRSNVYCDKIFLDGCPIAWSSNFKYLGVVFCGGTRLSIDLKPPRDKFFKNFNSIYGKIFKSSETVIISLLKSCCVPVLLYALEALDLNPTALRRLDNALFLAFCKTFKTFDEIIIMNCM